MIWIAIAAAVFFLDYFVKRWAENHLAGKERREIGKTGFSLKLIHNYGFAFNRLEKKPHLVKALHGVVVAILVFYSVTEVFFQKVREFAALGFALILGGGISNFYDRVKKGYVTDYLGLPKIKKLLFNLSDLFVFFGSILVVIGEFLSEL